MSKKTDTRFQAQDERMDAHDVVHMDAQKAAVKKSTKKAAKKAPVAKKTSSKATKKK